MGDLTEFQETLFETLDTVPEGRVVTYGQLAEMAGSPGAARAVGSAMKKEPAAGHPCWRVVGSDGSLHESAVGGPGEQRRRLREENVPFEDEDTVDLERGQYEP